MLLIFGKKIPENKRVRYALTTIFGIGLTSSQQVCNYLNIPQKLKVFDLTENQKTDISNYIKKNFIIDNQLKLQLKNNILTYINIKSIRGFRHRTKLPVRGQRTHSNGKTRKRVSNLFNYIKISK